MGITPNYKPKGSRAFVVEERNQVSKETLLETRVSHPELVHVMRVVNNLLGKSRLSPRQTLFGARQVDFIAGMRADQDERNNEIFRNLNIGSPFLHALKVREVAQAELQNALNTNRINRMLKRQNQYKQPSVRVGDSVSFFKNPGQKSDIRGFGPAQVLYPK